MVEQTEKQSFADFLLGILKARQGKAIDQKQKAEPPNHDAEKVAR
jgi:hypothetical protein